MIACDAGTVVKELFHITTRTAWNHAQSSRAYRPPTLDSEGFIHLSTDEQWRHTLHRFYRDEPDLVILRIDPSRLRSELRFERADGEDFPHLYGPLEVEAVVQIRDAPHVLRTPRGLAERLAAADDTIGEVALCSVFDRGRTAIYVVLAAKPGRAGQISLRDAMEAANPDDLNASGEVVGYAGWMQLHSFPRLPDGALDEVALLAYVESLVQND